MIKSILPIFMLYFFLIQGALAQERSELSLLEAYEILEKRYPILKNEAILDAIYQKELEQLDKTRMPSLYWKADGQIQTGSVSLDTEEGVMLPFEIDQPFFNAKTYIEGQYLIKDGGLLDAKKQLKSIALKANQHDFEVEKFALRKRVNALVLNINLLRSQTALFDISLQDLENNRVQIAALVENGLRIESELTKLEVKALEVKARKANVISKLSGLRNALAELLDIELADDFTIDFPTLASPTQIPELNRPETEAFQLKKAAILANSMLIDASKKPQLSAFAQAGVGYPNPINFLKNNVAPYGIAGLRFSWKLTDWKKTEIDRELLTLEATKLDNAEANFRFNMDTQQANYLSEVSRIQQQIEYDENIAQLQATILVQLAAQLEEGVLTSAEYVTQVNAELTARQNLVIHQSELLKLQLDYWNERGGF